MDHDRSPSSWFLALALTHVPMVVFTALAVLTAVERALGSVKTRTRECSPSECPSVCVQLPLLRERAHFARAIDRACALDWPRDALEVQVLDGGDDEDVAASERACAAWRQRGAVCHVVRASSALARRGRSTKARALEHARARTAATFIAVVDADADVEADYLRRMIPYFYDDFGSRREDVGVVHPAIAFVNASENFVTMHQGFKSEADAVAGNRAYARAFGCALRASGAAVWSAAALRAVGGWDERMVALEGVDMSIRTRMAGYSGKVAANVTVETELPSTLSAYRNQQLRWMGAWAYLAKRHALNVLFNPFSVVGGAGTVGGKFGGRLARVWFALAILRPAQWLLLAAWVLVLPELIVRGVWLGNDEYVIRGAVWLYLVPLLIIVKADSFAVSDVEAKFQSPPRSTGEAVKTARSTIRKLSWIAPHLCVSVGMIAVYCTGYVRGIFGKPFPSRDASVNQMRTLKLGDRGVAMDAEDDDEEETSCTTSDVWQLVLELVFIVAVCRASIELARFRAVGAAEAGSLSFVSMIGFAIAASCVYVAAGGWDDKCGPRTSERYRRRVRAANDEERAGLLSSDPVQSRAASLSTRARASTSATFTADAVAYENIETGIGSGTDFVVGDAEEDDFASRIDAPPPATSREVQKAIKKYKQMRDHEFDLENYSEYAQSDVTSVRSEAYAPSHVNFESHVSAAREDFSDFGSVADGEDERSVDLDGRDRAALAHALQVERDAQLRAKSLRMAHIRVAVASPSAPSASTRPPPSPRSRETSAENSPMASTTHPSTITPTVDAVVDPSEWIDAPIPARGAPTSARRATDA